MTEQILIIVVPVPHKVLSEALRTRVMKQVDYKIGEYQVDLRKKKVRFGADLNTEDNY